MNASGTAADYLARLNDRIARMEHVTILPKDDLPLSTKRMKKIHRGVGFPPGRPFVAALAARGVQDRSLLRAAWAHAESSRAVNTTRRPAPRLRTTLPRSRAWNELVCWDCFVIPFYLAKRFPRQHQRTIMHGTCSFIRLMEAGLVTDHTGQGYCDMIEHLWYRKWGPPGGNKVDLGTAFDSDEFLIAAGE